MTEEIEITKGEKKLTVKYNKYTKKIEITGYFSEEIPDGIFTGQVTERSDGGIYIWSPDMEVTLPLREVELIIDGDDGNLYIDSYFVGAFKNKEVFKYRLANGSHWIRVQTEFYDNSIPWSFNDETPFLPNTTKHTFKYSIPIQYQSKMASSYIDRWANPVINVIPANALITLTNTKTKEELKFGTMQAIVLTEGEEYSLKISSEGYGTYTKTFIFEGGRNIPNDEELQLDNGNPATHKIILDENLK